MKFAPNSPIRVAALGVLLVGFAGCGLESPMAPTSGLQESGTGTAAISVVRMPIEDDPGRISEGNETPDPTVSTGEQRKQKKDKKTKKSHE